MDQTVMWLMMCAGSAAAGVLIGLLLTKRLRENEWHEGFGAGIEVLASAIKWQCRKVQTEGTEWAYRVPVAGLDRVVEQAKAQETAKRDQEK